MTSKSKFKKGDTFYLQKGLPSDLPYKCHVLAIVDDDMVVYKWYGRRKQYWHYEVEWDGSLELRMDKSIKLKRRKK